MIVALIDSGLGLLPTAARLRQLRPSLDLLLQLDPRGAPWGPRPESWVIERVVTMARRAVEEGARAVVLPCNTASVTALDWVRADLGSEIPVVGTVPAIKPAVAACSSIAIWATVATTKSRYQADLLERFGRGARSVGVACHGLADAIDAGDDEATRAAIGRAVKKTPPDVGGVVLGCTHYPLVSDAIVAALPGGVRLFDSVKAVADQTMRRLDALGDDDTGEGAGTVHVLLSGRPGTLPDAALKYEPGRQLAAVDAVDPSRVPGCI